MPRYGHGHLGVSILILWLVLKDSYFETSTIAIAMSSMPHVLVKVICIHEYTGKTKV